MTQDLQLPPLSSPEGWPVFSKGLVWLLGAGPGDPSLMTLQGLNALRQADVIVYDALVNKQILDWASPQAEIEYAGKRGGKPSPKQRDISLRLITLAQAGKRVLRLKGGDPFVFGRGGEEALALVKAGIPIRITPGITAGIGGLAYAGVPVTHRDFNQSVTFLTGHDQTGEAPGAVDWSALAQGGQTLVLYMAIKHLNEITQKLVAGGRHKKEPVLIVTNATLPTQTMLETTLEKAAQDVEHAQIKPPAIICIGQNVQLHHALNWRAQLQGQPADLSKVISLPCVKELA